MSKFKAGDYVKRIRSKHGGMKIGTIGTIKNIVGNTVYFEELFDGANYGHSIGNLEILTEEEIIEYEKKRNTCTEKNLEILSIF